ncbi:MAG: universal stress protein [Verrucomicrobiae bacterium]|nr:universal stress protein [Verrucomicrobiae bacterium]
MQIHGAGKGDDEEARAVLEPQVVFATDLAGDLQTGLELATRLARERSATLVILHVVPLAMERGEGMLHTAVDLAAGTAERFLDTLVPPDPTVPFLRVQEIGNPEDRIAAFAAREQVGLLVMETRPRPWFGRYLGRGLVQRLMERCLCPMVTYQARKPFARVLPSWPVRDALAPVSAEVLTTVLNARVDALVTWMHMHENAAANVAGRRSVADAVAALSRAGASVFADGIRKILLLELAEYQHAWGAVGVEVVVRGQPLLRVGVTARPTASYRAYVERVRRSGKAVSVPLDGESLEWDPCVILAGAAVPELDDQGAVLSFVFDARRDFLRILAQPGPAPSAETYAFDDDGVMLSNSRFPDQLRRAGILPGGLAVQTPRRVRVCDPGGNLLRGDGTLASPLPLTRAAAAAIAGHDGCDFSGYRDYRGVEVVGAWRWLPEYGFGVAAEMDRDVA